MKKLVLLFSIVIFSITIASCSSDDDFLYDPSQETPELKAKYDKMLAEAEPLVIKELKSRKWLGKKSEYKSAFGVIIEDRLVTYLLSNGQEITFRESQFTDADLWGSDVIVKVVLDDKGKVVRIVDTFFTPEYREE